MSCGVVTTTGAGYGILRQGQLDIAGTGWQVDEEIIDIVPSAFGTQVVARLTDHRAAPNDGLVGIDQKPMDIT